jgi:hypothetical protein
MTFGNGLSWHWHWSVFLLALPVFVGLVAVARVATNESTVREFGSYADYKIALQTRPGTIVTGTLVAGAIYSALVTAIAGLV